MEEIIGKLDKQAFENEFEHLGTVDVFLENCNFAKLTQEEIRCCVKHGDSGTATTGITGCPRHWLPGHRDVRLLSHDTRRQASEPGPCGDG